MLTFGSLFAGIGGFDLGLERAGMTAKWQVEIDPFCLGELEKHWPDVRRYQDVRTVHGMWAADAPCGDDYCDSCLPAVDVLCGGFPCQPHSLAGKRGGAADERDLWPQFARLIREVRPRWVLAENVPGLLSNDAGRFFGGVLRDLAESGYDAEWDCIPASAFGADHERDRVWIIAYAATVGLGAWRPRRPDSSDTGQPEQALQDADPAPGGREGFDVSVRRRRQGPTPVVFTGCRERWDASAWPPEPAVGRVVHGLPDRLARQRNEQQIGALGNSIVPQIAEWLGRRILEADEAMRVA